MDEEMEMRLSKERSAAQLWVDEDSKVVSFHPEEGFQAVSFPSRDDMLTYVFQQGANGFRIQ